jgi:hypothetical protein
MQPAAGITPLTSNPEQISRLQVAVTSLHERMLKVSDALANTQNTIVLSEISKSSTGGPGSDGLYSAPLRSKESFTDPGEKPSGTKLWSASWSHQYNQWYWWNKQTKETSWEQPVAAIAGDQLRDIDTLETAVTELAGLVKYQRSHAATATSNATSVAPSVADEDAKKKEEGGGEASVDEEDADQTGEESVASEEVAPEPAPEEEEAPEEAAPEPAPEEEDEDAPEEAPEEEAPEEVVPEQAPEEEEEEEEAPKEAAPEPAPEEEEAPEEEASVDEEEADQTGEESVA